MPERALGRQQARSSNDLAMTGMLFQVLEMSMFTKSEAMKEFVEVDVPIGSWMSDLQILAVGLH